MICPNCGHSNPDQAQFCSGCGNQLSPSVPASEVPEQPVVQPVECPVEQPTVRPMERPITAFDPYTVPYAYKPISAWGYFGWKLLFAIPLVGFVLLIIFSCGVSENKNLTNFARSYFCFLLIVLIVVLVLLLFSAATVFSFRM